MAVNIAALNQVYNHYMTNYAPKSSTSLDSHKRSELRGIYNSIVKINKDSPLYLLNHDDETKAYAIGLKENARELRNTIVSLGSMKDDNLLGKKVAYSTNSDLVSATYIGTDQEPGDLPAMSVEVKSLASPQVNMGNFLPKETVSGLNPDTYSLDITIHDMSYEFQFNVHEEDTNQDIEERLCRLINGSNIGLTAETVEDGEGNISLKLSSVSTGLENDKNSIFRVNDNYTSKTSGMVDYLGIGEITRSASNAVFSIDGIEHSTNSNHFTIDKTYEFELKGISQNDADITQIGIKNDNESLKENIRTLVGSYNNFLKTASEYTESHPKSRQLLNEMGRISASYADRLQTLGLNLTGDGTLKINEETLESASADINFSDRLSSVKDFTGSVLKKAGDISLNPMNYVERTIVAYKNPAAHNFPAPYVTSEYSGMLFNSYC